MPAQVGPSAQKRRVLVVEDDSFVGALVCDALTSAGFLVERAAEAAAAMRAVQRFDPDAAILDISLGEGPSGLDVAHVLHRQRPDIAVLFLTHHPDPRTAGRPADALPPPGRVPA